MEVLKYTYQTKNKIKILNGYSTVPFSRTNNTDTAIEE